MTGVAAERVGAGDRASQVPHVVIVGTGFAGLNAARRLSAAAETTPIRITMVDRHNYHTFQPLLYQVATAGLEPQSIGHNVRGIFRHSPVEFRLGAVVDIDADARRLQLDDGSHLHYDTLVLAAGAVTADYGIPGVADHAFPLKWVPEAERLRDHILLQFERVETHPEEMDRGALTFVIAGGGPTGVELAGAVAELIDRVIRHDHPRVDVSRSRIVLVEMLDTLLPAYSERSRRYTREALEKRGVEVRLGTAIEEVHEDRVAFSDGQELPSATVVWTAGISANPLGERLGGSLTKGGRVEVESDLRAVGCDDVFVVGDLAGGTDGDRQLLPQLAPVAIQQGKHAAEQILRLRRGEPTVAFRYRDRGTMATIGRNDAVAEVPIGLKLRGGIAWLAWLGLHLLYLIGFRNRATVLLNWTYNYLTYDRAARLILTPQTTVGTADDTGAGTQGP